MLEDRKKFLIWLRNRTDYTVTIHKAFPSKAENLTKINGPQEFLVFQSPVSS